MWWPIKEVCATHGDEFGGNFLTHTVFEQNCVLISWRAHYLCWVVHARVRPLGINLVARAKLSRRHRSGIFVSPGEVYSIGACSRIWDAGISLHTCSHHQTTSLQRKETTPSYKLKDIRLWGMSASFLPAFTHACKENLKMLHKQRNYRSSLIIIISFFFFFFCSYLRWHVSVCFYLISFPAMEIGKSTIKRCDCRLPICAKTETLRCFSPNF